MTVGILLLLCVVGGVVVMRSQGVWWLCVVRVCGGYV